MTIKEKIEQFLSEQSPDEYNLPVLAKRINENPNSVRRYARELTNEGKIVNTKRGYYRSKDVDIIHQIPFERLMLHGIGIECRSNKVNTHDYLPKITIYNMHRNPQSGGITSDMDYRGRKVTFTVYDGLLMIWVQSSLKPMSYSDFDGFCGWLEGKFPNINLREYTLKNVDMNIDIRGLTEGFQHLNLQMFKNAWFTIYQKNDDIIRIEERMVLNIDLEKALNIFKKMMYSDVEIKI